MRAARRRGAASFVGPAFAAVWILAGTWALAEEPSLVEQEQAGSLLRLAGENAELRPTAHFLVAHTASDDALLDFIGRIEATHRAAYRFLKIHDFPAVESEQRLGVLFFATFDEYHAYAHRAGLDATGAAGFYQPSTNLAAFYDAASAPRLIDLNHQLARLETRLKDPNLPNAVFNAQVKQLRRLRSERDRTIEMVNHLVVQHEVAHQVFYNAGLHPRGGDHPTWLVEGLACLFETPPNEYGAGLGAVNQYRLVNFREALAGHADARRASTDDFPGAICNRRLVSLATLIGGDRLFDTRETNVENIYAEAWSLVYYLHQRRRTSLGAYLAVLARRPADRAYSPAAEIALFEATFGPLDDHFRRRWLGFVLSKRLHAR